MKNLIGLKELRERTGPLIKRVGAGETLIVMRHSKPVFKISPVDDEQGWETVIDFTKIRKGGVPAAEVLARLKAMK